MGLRILFLTGPTEDYLADSILHGLRTLYGADVVDYPKCEALYENCPDVIFKQVRGHGFTLYRTLPDIEVNRFNIVHRQRSGDFDLVIFGSIYRNYATFVDWLPWLRPESTILLDGEDTQGIAPYGGKWWRRSACFFWPKAHGEYRYFKREWGPESLHYRTYRLLPLALCRHWFKYLNLKPISFSIPEEKITKKLSVKTKLFSEQIVDEEVALLLGRAGSGYKFNNEADYYADLQASKFGVTTRRAGWDCLRHYEFAANGCVPCFRDLDKKPNKCAPHGLNEKNSISYSSAGELMEITNAISEDDYAKLQAGSLAWAHENSTVMSARRMLTNGGGA